MSEEPQGATPHDYAMGLLAGLEDRGFGGCDPRLEDAIYEEALDLAERLWDDERMEQIGKLRERVKRLENDLEGARRSIHLATYRAEELEGRLRLLEEER